MSINNLFQEIKENHVVLVLIPKGMINRKGIEIIKLIEANSGGIGVLSFNQPYSILSESVKKGGISPEKIFFIDVLSAGVYRAKKMPNCLFVSSPEDLTEISLMCSEMQKTGEVDTCVIESISTMLVYQDELSVIQFAHSIINKSRNLGIKLVITAAKEDINTELVKDLHMFVDTVIEVE